MVGSGSTRCDFGVLGAVLVREPGASCRRAWTSRRSQSTSSTRNARSSPTRSPSPAWVVTIARMRNGIASRSASTCWGVTGTTRGRSARGTVSRRPTGERLTSRSSTADA